jgi:hypothetical protein
MSQEKEEQPADQLDRDSSLVMVMILVHKMLKLDYTMQVNPHLSIHLRIHVCLLTCFRIELP